MPDLTDTATQARIRACIGRKVRRYIQDAQPLDCADVAISAFAECAIAEGFAVQVPVHDSATGQVVTLRSTDFPNVAAYVRRLRQSIGAISLFDRNLVTTSVAFDRMAEADLVVFDLRPQGNSAYTGHTMVVLQNDPGQARVTVGEGHIGAPPAQATYRYADLRRHFQGPAESHIGPVGDAGRVWSWTRLLTPA